MELKKTQYADPRDQEMFNWYGVVYCPAESCGVHLDNGVAETSKEYRHEKYQFVCLGCCTEFGPELEVEAPTPAPEPAKKVSKTGKASPKDMDLRAKVLVFLDQLEPGMATAARVKLTASVFEITSANARYYVSRVWRKV